MKDHDLLRKALLDLARGEDVSRIVETKLGVKYVLEGALESPDGRVPEVRSVWISDSGYRPRFLTAYPLRSSPT